MIVFLETVFGCDRDCKTKCGGWGKPRVEMPPEICGKLIKELREKDGLQVHLYGRGDVNGYPFHEVRDIRGCYVVVTRSSYETVEYLRSRGATVFSRIEVSSDLEEVPPSDGYFVVQTTREELLSILTLVGGLRPLAIKSLDIHMGYEEKGYGGDLRLMELPPPFNVPSSVLSYSIPSSDCKIPLIGYDLDRGIYCKPCVSVDGEFEYRNWGEMRGFKPHCEFCERFPRQKRIFYYEENTLL